MLTGHIVNSTAMVAAAVLVSGRVYLRIIKEKRYALEEFLLVASLIFYLVLGGLHACMFNLLPQMADPLKVIELKKFFTFGAYLYIGTIFCTKLAIIRFHLQLTEGFWINKLARYTMWAIAALWPLNIIIYSIGCLPLPFEAHWALDPAQSCKPVVGAWDFWITWVCHIITDIMLVALPFPALARIKDTNLRLAISGVYGLGLVGIATSTVRIILMSIDAEKSVGRIIMLSSVEMSVHIIVATIPGISGTFIKRYRNRTSNKGSSSYGRTPGLAGSHMPKSTMRNGTVVVGQVSPHDVELEGSVGGHSSPFGDSTDEIVQKQ